MKTFDHDTDRNYDDLTNALARLRSFDPNTFVGDHRLSQDVCNIVLAMTLIYNDLKDSIYAYLLIERERPGEQAQDTPAWGNYGGLKQHVRRAQMALLHELVYLLQKKKKSLDDPGFQAIVKQLTGPSRKAMHSLLQIAQEKAPSNKVGKVLLMVRHKIASHYDPGEIFRGFKKRFIDEAAQGPPLVSAGAGMLDSRFYYADATAQRYMKLMMDEAKVTEPELAQVVDDVNLAILQLVERFMSYRGFGLRDLALE